MGLTQALARYAANSHIDALPAAVRHECARALVNWMGVTIAGSAADAASIAARYVAKDGSLPQASVIGHGFRTSVASAAFVNCVASSVLAYDDAHLPTVAHPSGPALAALFALAQSRPISGREFVNAVALGIELQCRIANMLVLSPSPINPKFYINGFSGPIGVAAAVGRIAGLDEVRMAWAIGLAASQASGFRASHGTMNSHFRPGNAARAGVVAAMLSGEGFDCIEDALEVPGGFIDVYAPGCDPALALVELGECHVMLENRYKPYPCGIVVNPVIDACRDIRSRLPAGCQIARVLLTVNPLVLTLTGIRSPQSTLEAQISVYHWAAAALLRDDCGRATPEAECRADRQVIALREIVEAEASPAIGKGQALGQVWLDDGTMIKSRIVHARGSLERPMSDAELDSKFADLASGRIDTATSDRIRALCWDVAGLGDVGAAFGGLLP